MWGLRCYIVRLDTYGLLGELSCPLVRVRDLAAGGLGACLDGGADAGSNTGVGVFRECFTGRAQCGVCAEGLRFLRWDGISREHLFFDIWVGDSCGCQRHGADERLRRTTVRRR
jgi:hypothetical protein